MAGSLAISFQFPKFALKSVGSIGVEGHINPENMKFMLKIEAGSFSIQFKYEFLFSTKIVPSIRPDYIF